MPDSINIVHSTGAGAVVIQDGRRAAAGAGRPSPTEAGRACAGSRIAESGEARNRAGREGAAPSPGMAGAAAATTPSSGTTTTPSSGTTTTPSSDHATAGDDRSTTPTVAELARAVATLAKIDGARGKRLGTLHREFLRNAEYAAAFAEIGAKVRTRSAARPVTRTGKIARLPRELRRQVNVRLKDGQTGKEIAEWLNAQPGVVTILACHRGGSTINEKNVGEWRRGGFQDWLQTEEGRR